MKGIPQKDQRSGPAFFCRPRLPLAVMAVVFAFGFRAGAFSLLGPYADWMQETNGFRAAGDIGGPMDITEGYRWNVPVVTYGFDQTFLEFFGTQGVAAVESAIKVINDLPAASQINLTNYPLNSLRSNFRARANWLVDLKSSAFYLLMEEVGLAQPVRSIFVVRGWDPLIPDYGDEMSWPAGTIPYYISERNFDPETLRPSHWVDGNLYTGVYFQEGGRAYVQPFSVDPTSFSLSVSEGFYWEHDPFGSFYSGLTYDDVGGLRYLLSRTNVNYEHLLGDVRAANRPGRRRELVNGAWRPGVEKITFARQPFDGVSGRFVPLTIPYIDSYIVSGVTRHQNVRRVVRQPDVLFCAGDNGPPGASLSLFGRTGTTNWLNNAALNGNPGAAGPGVIQPQVKITFQKLGLFVLSDDFLPPDTSPMSWATFDGTTNAPIQYPAGNGAGAGGFMVRLSLIGGQFGGGVEVHTWHVAVPPGGQAALQSSTNLADWVSVATVANNGTIVEWQHYGTATPTRFFRVVPQ